MIRALKSESNRALSSGCGSPRNWAARIRPADARSSTRPPWKCRTRSSPCGPANSREANCLIAPTRIDVGSTDTPARRQEAITLQWSCREPGCGSTSVFAQAPGRVCPTRSHADAWRARPAPTPDEILHRGGEVRPRRFGLRISPFWTIRRAMVSANSRWFAISARRNASLIVVAVCCRRFCLRRFCSASCFGGSSWTGAGFGGSGVISFVGALLLDRFLRLVSGRWTAPSGPSFGLIVVEQVELWRVWHRRIRKLQPLAHGRVGAGDARAFACFAGRRSGGASSARGAPTPDAGLDSFAAFPLEQPCYRDFPHWRRCAEACRSVSTITAASRCAMRLS